MKKGGEHKEPLLPVEEVDGPTGKELMVRFEYKAVAKGTRQDTLVAQATGTVLADAAVNERPGQGSAPSILVERVPRA